MQFNRSQGAIASVVNDLAMFLDERWKHLLEYDHEYLLHSHKLVEYAKAIYESGAALLNIFGFIDEAIWRICKPICHQ